MASARSITATLIAPATIAAFDPDGLVPSGPLRFGVGLSLMLVLASTTTSLTSPIPRVARRVGAGLGIAITIATLVGADRWHGLVGTPDRRFGLLTWLVTIGSFGVGARLHEWRDALGRGATLAAVVIGGVGVAESFGFRPAGSATAGGRWSGLVGQPAYLGTAAAFFGLIAIAQIAGPATDTSSRAWRAAGALGALGCTLALVGSGTRGAVVGVAGGLIVAASLRPQRRAVRFAAGLAVVVAVAVTFQLTADRTITRLDEWAIGWRAFTNSPLLGYGPEGYRVVFGRAVTEDYQQTYGSSAFTDRAHQGMLDLALVGGVVAVVCLVAGLLLTSRIVWRNRDRLDGRDLFIVAALVSHFVGQQVLFPIAWLEPTVWLTAGTLVGSILAATGDQAGPAGRATPSRPSLWPRMTAAVLVALAALTMAAAGAEALAERRLNAEAATNLIDQDVVLDAVALRPDSIRVRFAAAQLLKRNESIFSLDEALGQLEAALAWSPQDPAVNRRYVELLNERARRSEIPADATVAWTEARALTWFQPRDPRSLRAAAEAARRVGETALASEFDAAAVSNDRETSGE